MSDSKECAKSDCIERLEAIHRVNGEIAELRKKNGELTRKVERARSEATIWATRFIVGASFFCDGLPIYETLLANMEFVED